MINIIIFILIVFLFYGLFNCNYNYKNKLHEDFLMNNNPNDFIKNINININNIKNIEDLNKNLLKDMNNSNLEDSTENNNQIFFIGEQKLKRVLLGGFFAKVKKSLERRSHNQNILNSIKVANFEITLR